MTKGMNLLGALLGAPTRGKGSWTFGGRSLEKCERFSFFYSPGYKKSTLREIMKSNCAPETVVISDEWLGYSRLTEDGYRHKTVNHYKQFVNPENGAHTQGIEMA